VIEQRILKQNLMNMGVEVEVLYLYSDSGVDKTPVNFIWVFFAEVIRLNFAH
jgi:hypothetical protein